MTDKEEGGSTGCEDVLVQQGERKKELSHFQL